MKIRILNGEMEGHELEFDRDVVTIGRKAENDVALPLDLRVSRFHATMGRGCSGQWVLEDLDSTNGSFIGRRRIYAPTALEESGTFRIGRTWLEVTEPVPEYAAAEAVVFVEEGEAEAEGDIADAVVTSIDAGAGAQSEDARLRELSREELEERLSAIREVGRAVSSTLELSDLLSKLLHSIVAVMPAERAILVFVNPDTGELEPRAVWPREEAKGELALSRSIVERAMSERVTLLLSDAMSDERFGQMESVIDLHIRSAICAPLLAARPRYLDPAHSDDAPPADGDEVIGVIFLDTTAATHVFDRADAEMVSIIASQAAVAIQNARLYTDLREAYENLQNAQEQLVSSEKLAIIGTLSAAISHDMANAVSPMVTLIDMALERGAVDEHSEEVLQRQLGRLMSMVQRLRSFSGHAGASDEELALEVCDINEVVGNSLSLVGTELTHEGIDVTLELAEDLPTVMAAPSQLDRVLLNLCVNAMEAMADAPEPKSLRISTELDGDEVTISVADTGPGIAPEAQDKLFEPFYSTKRQGTGLGLFSCRRIVEDEHHGSIELDSRQGEGTTITVRLPLPA